MTCNACEKICADGVPYNWIRITDDYGGKVLETTLCDACVRKVRAMVKK